MSRRTEAFAQEEAGQIENGKPAAIAVEPQVVQASVVGVAEPQAVQVSVVGVANANPSQGNPNVAVVAPVDAPSRSTSRLSRSASRSREVAAQNPTKAKLCQ